MLQGELSSCLMAGALMISDFMAGMVTAPGKVATLGTVAVPSWVRRAKGVFRGTTG